MEEQPVGMLSGQGGQGNNSNGTSGNHNTDGLEVQMQSEIDSLRRDIQDLKEVMMQQAQARPVSQGRQTKGGNA